MNGLLRSILRILITLLIIYAILCLCVFAFQRSLLYIPTRIPANAIESVAREHGFQPWKNPAGQIIGWKIPSQGAAVGSVLIVHGNAGSAVGRDYLAQPVHDATNVDVFVLEYPGYGAREGSPTKASLIAAGEEAFSLLPKGGPKYVVSESIGAGVACELARHHAAEIAGMVLFVPYDNLARVAQKHMPIFPAYFLLLDRFNPAECLKSYHGPVKFVVAAEDEIIGAASGKRLYDGYAGPKDLWVVPDAHHNDVSGQPANWWREVFAFWQTKRN